MIIVKYKKYILSQPVGVLKPFGLSFLDYPNNFSQALLIYLSGCDFKCQNCHNVKLRDGKLSDIQELCNVPLLYQQLFIMGRKFDIDKIVMSGGDPLAHKNINFTKSFLQINRYFDICLYTGYSIQEVLQKDIKGFNYLKCGVYDKSNRQPSVKDDNGQYLASKNQKMYDGEFNLLSKDGYIQFNENGIPEKVNK